MHLFFFCSFLKYLRRTVLLCRSVRWSTKLQILNKFCRCRCLKEFINYDFLLFVYKQISCFTRPAFATPRSESRDPLWVATHRLKTTGIPYTTFLAQSTNRVFSGLEIPHIVLAEDFEHLHKFPNLCCIRKVRITLCFFAILLILWEIPCTYGMAQNDLISSFGLSSRLALSFCHQD